MARQGETGCKGRSIPMETLDGGGSRRDHLRALAQRVEVADREVRIIGSKSNLLPDADRRGRRKAGRAWRSQSSSEVAGRDR